MSEATPGKKKRRRKSTPSSIDGLPPTSDYRYGDKRTNLPPAKIAGEADIPKAKKVKYAYSPHLDPILRFDPTARADKVAAIVEKSCRGERLDAQEQEILRAVGKNWEQPWLEWAGKQEEHARGHFTVDPVALHIHERISAQAILRTVQRKDVEPSLFASPEQSYSEALSFYKYDVDWANRLILGDSMQVMSSLAYRENLAGKVQMIYFDPPYGIKFGSNFQASIGQRESKDGNDRDLTHEPEMIRAFRDTWHLGTSSYLSYLRDRIAIARTMLTPSGSIFVQISEANKHFVRCILDDVFGPKNFVVEITVKKKSSAKIGESVADYLIWYAADKSRLKPNRIALQRGAPDDAEKFRKFELPNGERLAARFVSKDQKSTNPSKWLRDDYPVDSQHESRNRSARIAVSGRYAYPPSNRQWTFQVPEGMARLERCGRLRRGNRSAFGVVYWGDGSLASVSNIWTEFHGEADPSYVVQTNRGIVERCILMATKPGDIVLDITCGSGTTPWASERWGRRWIAIDTSRVAIAVARERILTANFEHFRTKGGPIQPLGAENPGSGFECESVAQVTLSAIVENVRLDPILDRHDAVLAEKLKNANARLADVPLSVRKALKAKLDAKAIEFGSSSITDADRRRWILPPENRDPKEEWAVDASHQGWYEWEVPFDTDPEWPNALQDAVVAYRAAWRAKMDEVNECIEKNAEHEYLVDAPRIEKDVVRVSGPFTIEGTIPEEMSLTDAGAVDLMPRESGDESARADDQNTSAYLTGMVNALRKDGILFPNNRKRMFAAVEPLDRSGNLDALHAEATWEGDTEPTVALSFGPQYGPVTARQVENLMRAARRYDHLVIAAFSFAPEANALIEESKHPKLQVHMTHIRPDMIGGMKGLLRETPNSQLFTVFGSPSIEVRRLREDAFVVELEGVDIFDPITSKVDPTVAEKVAAWFLDTDFDGRCFCACQAFFPHQDAWEKIAKSLGDDADPEAFAAFKGTTSLPFKPGKHRRVAVKVIDPRGNEVMSVRDLKD